MKRVWGHVLAGLSLLAGGGVAFSACVHNDSTLFVRDALLAQYRQNGTVCSYTADPAQPFTSTGLLDVGLRRQYDGSFLVGNQLEPQVNPNQLQTETSTVTIQGAIVRVTDASGRQISTFTRLTTATIPPASSGIPGYATVFVTIVDPLTIQNDQNIQQNLAPGGGGRIRLVSYVRFFGKTLGGQSIESNEFEFPVDVCNGCLINFTNNPMYPLPNCVGNAASSTWTPHTEMPCQIGQDLAVDCSICQTFSASCSGAYQAVPSAPDAGSG